MGNPEDTGNIYQNRQKEEPPPKKNPLQIRKKNRNKERNVSIVIFQHHQAMELIFQNSC